MHLTSEENFEFYMTVTRDGRELELRVEGHSYYDPGVCSGPPEVCYPPEGDCEITEIWLQGPEPGDEIPWSGCFTPEEAAYADDVAWSYFRH